jgi:putative glutamine amidotransferase
VIPEDSPRPFIGITGRRQPLAAPGTPPIFADALGDLFITDFARCVFEAGGTPMLLAPEDDSRAYTDHLVSRLDGLVLTGGPDMDPRLYGRLPGPRSTPVDPCRDAFELSVIASAEEAGMPILGVCRGAQVINVSRGGTLVLDLPQGEGEAHDFYGYPRAHRSHRVLIKESSMLDELFGSTMRVNSFHHQAVDELGRGLIVTARAEDDVVEGIEDRAGNILGVQWHPEWLADLAVFGWVVDRASRLAEDRARSTRQRVAR